MPVSTVRIVLAFFPVFLSAGVLAAGEAEPKETLYQQTSRMVVHLEFKNPVTNEYTPQGTGFFIRDEANNLYIVTARHVAEIPLDLRARVSSMLTATRKTDVIELRLPAGRWVYHENAGSANEQAVDVAAMKIPYIRERGIVSFRYCKTCPEGEYNQLDANPSPPDHVLIFGFPKDLGFTLTEQRPMTRQGVVAMTSDETFLSVKVSETQKKRLPKGVFLIDARMFGGESGGPVIIVNPFTKLRLGGLVTATNRALDYGIVTPVSQIIETIERAKSAEANFNAWHKLEPQVAQK